MNKQLIKQHCENVTADQIMPILIKFYGWDANSPATYFYVAQVLRGEISPSDSDAQIFISCAARVAAETQKSYNLKR